MTCPSPHLMLETWVVGSTFSWPYSAVGLLCFHTTRSAGAWGWRSSHCLVSDKSLLDIKGSRPSLFFTAGSLSLSPSPPSPPLSQSLSVCFDLQYIMVNSFFHRTKGPSLGYIINVTKKLERKSINNVVVLTFARTQPLNQLICVSFDDVGWTLAPRCVSAEPCAQQKTQVFPGLCETRRWDNRSMPRAPGNAEERFGNLLYSLTPWERLLKPCQAFHRHHTGRRCYCTRNGLDASFTVFGTAQVLF